MRRFHVIAVTEDLTRTFVIRTEAGWMLPWFDDNPRAELPDQLRAVLSPRVGPSEMVHEAPLRPDFSTNPLPFYCLALVSGSNGSGNITAVPNADLAAAPALMSLQREGWLSAIARLRTPAAPFDSGPQVAALLEWAGQLIRDRAGARIVSIVRHRCARHEYVVRLHTTDGTMYLKAGRERARDEARLTELLWTTSPRQFPETLGLDLVHDRWVYRELPGERLVGPLLTREAMKAAARALAAVQKCVTRQPAIVAHLAERHLNAVDLYARVDEILQTAWNEVGSDGHRDAGLPAYDAWAAGRDAMLHTCAAVDHLELPSTLILSDFWPPNILGTPDGIGFIDVEQSYWGVPCLSLWRFTREVERALQAGRGIRRDIEGAYVEEWADLVDPLDMRTALASLPLLGRLFNVVMSSWEFDRRERDLGAALPAGYRAAQLAPKVQRLLELTATPLP